MKVSTAALRSNSRLDPGMIALVAALIFLPLYPKVGLIAISGTYIPVRIDDFVTIAVVAAWALTLLRDRRLPRVPPFATAVGAWLGIGLVSLVIGAGVLRTISWTTGALFWAKPIEYLVLGWVAYDLVVRRDRLRLIIGVILCSAALVLAYALLERFGWFPHAPNYATDVTLRRVLGSTMGDSHQMATYLGIVVLLGITLWHRASRSLQVVAIVGFGLTAYILAHAAGRSEYLSLAVCALLLTIWRPSRMPGAIMVVMLAVAFVLPQGIEDALDQAVGRRAESIAIGPTPSFVTGDSSPAPQPTPAPTPAPISVGERLDDLGADRSLQIRLQERWPVFIALGMRNPLFGAGPSAATEAADGYYVRSFAEIGIVGTAAFFLVLLSVLNALRRVVRSSVGEDAAMALGLIAATLFIALVGVLIDTWVASRVMQLYWPAVGAAISLSLNQRRDDDAAPATEAASRRSQSMAH